MAMSCPCNSSSATATYKLRKLLVFFFVFTICSWNSDSVSAAAIDSVSYADHCGSIVPQSTPKTTAGLGPFVRHHTGYYTGDGSGNLSPSSSYPVQNSVQLIASDVRETNVQGLFKIRANLQFERASIVYYVGASTNSKPQFHGGVYNYQGPGSIPRGRRSGRFFLDGFWSASSGKLCMVGPGTGIGNNFKGHSYLYAVLKLYNLMNSTSVTSLISGTLESLFKNHPNNFEPVSILMLPSMNYQYTRVSNKSDTSFSGAGSDDPVTSLQIQTFCSVLSRKVLNYEFGLKYSSHCVAAKNCTPFVASGLPHYVSLKPIECFEDTRRLRVLVEFADSSKVWNQRTFDPNSTLVGEGSWDAKKNQLFVVACQFLDATDSWNNTHIGDCSTRLSLRFPAIWTIGNTSGVVGQIWSNKTVTELGYFERITFESPQNKIRRILLPGQKYEYTQIDKVTKLCPRKKSATANDKTNIYPNPFSYDMRFDMSARNSEGVVSWGSSVPLSVGHRFYHQNLYTGNGYSVASTEKYPGDPVSYNISYKISVRLASNAKLGNASIVNEVQISAEGIYDHTEGNLCMVGCRNVGSNILQATSDSVDCELVINFQFPPANSSDYIKGSIESTRKRSDPLHFERLDFSSAAGYVVEAKRSIWRMDVEMTLALISTTLACVFVALQLFHVKKHPDMLPSISISMLLILTLGYMIPLVLNFDAMFTHKTSHQNVSIGGGRLEVNEVIVRVITMAAFLLQIHLLRLTWSARSENATRMEVWLMEKNALFVALPVYAAGALAAFLLMNGRKIGIGNDVGALQSYSTHPNFSTALKSYAGLVLDGFLLPQILLNIFCKSQAKALSVSFYFGTTFVRVLPHAYDLYRAHNSAHHQLNESYIYANPVADFYSTAWDVIIPFGGLLFAGIIYLQQKFGGRCIFPQKLRDFCEYEKVPTVTVG